MNAGWPSPSRDLKQIWENAREMLIRLHRIPLFDFFYFLSIFAIFVSNFLGYRTPWGEGGKKGEDP